VKLLAHRAGLPGNGDMITRSALAGKFPLTPLSMAGSRGTISKESSLPGSRAL